MIVQASSSEIVDRVNGASPCLRFLPDHPEQLPIHPILMKLALGKVACSEAQKQSGRAVAFALLVMAVMAGPFPLKQGFPFGNILRGRRNGIPERFALAIWFGGTRG